MRDVKVGALSVHKAGELMDKNFLGIERAKWRFGKDVFVEDEKELSEMVFSKNFLERHKNTHILAAIPSLSINDIRDKLSKLDVQNKAGRKVELFNSDYEYFRYHNGREFTKRRGEASWQLVRKTKLPDSQSKTWEEQKAVLSAGQYIPDARVMIYITIAYYLERKIKLFKDCFIRTADTYTSRDSSQVVIKNLGNDNGLALLCWNNLIHISNLGCAVAQELG